MSRLCKIEKGNDGNVPLNVFFFSFLFFPFFYFNYKLKKKKKKKKKDTHTHVKRCRFSGFIGSSN